LASNGANLHIRVGRSALADPPDIDRAISSIPIKALDPTALVRCRTGGTYFYIPTTLPQLIDLCGGEGVLTHGRAQKI